MPSRAAERAYRAFARAEILRRVTATLREKHHSENVQTYYHASLTACVAAWDSYLSNIVPEFYQVISNPLNVAYNAIATIAENHSNAALRRFNTPNFDNARTLLVMCTGYDPYSDWTWARRSMSVLQVKEYLNQILQVRHSFAHGFAIPSYQWTRGIAGKVRLTAANIADVEALLKHLISCTDKGLKGHVMETFGISPPW